MTVKNNRNAVSLNCFLDRLIEKISRELKGRGDKEYLCGTKVCFSHFKPELTIRQIRSFSTDYPDSSLHSDGLITSELYQNNSFKKFANNFIVELEKFTVDLRKETFQNKDDFEAFIEFKMKKLEELFK